MFQITTYVCQTSSNVLTYPPKCVKRVQMFQITRLCRIMFSLSILSGGRLCEMLSESDRG